MSLFSWFGKSISPYISIERMRDGSFWYTLFNSQAQFKKHNPVKAYKETFAFNRVVSIIKDTGKLANINLYENNRLLQSNYLYQVKPKPNPYQTWTELIEEYLFWDCLGKIYFWKQSSISIENQNFYFLNPARFDDDTIKLFKKFGKKLSNQSSSELLANHSNHIIKYQFNDNQTQDIPLKEVVVIQSDISLDSWFGNESRIDALEKIISNSESALDSKNINLHFTQKYVAYQGENKNDKQAEIMGLSKTESDDIKMKAMSKDPLLVSGANNLEVKRFIDNLKQLGFDESFINDYLLIGLFYNVPVEVLGDFLRGKGLSSQGDAKEKAMVQFVDMCLMPRLQKLTDVLELGLAKNQEVKAEFTHLWFMKVVLKQRSEQRKLDLESLKIAQEMGMDEVKVQEQLKLIYDDN